MFSKQKTVMLGECYVFSIHKLNLNHSNMQRQNPRLSNQLLIKSLSSTFLCFCHPWILESVLYLLSRNLKVCGAFRDESVSPSVRQFNPSDDVCECEMK